MHTYMHTYIHAYTNAYIHASIHKACTLEPYLGATHVLNGDGASQRPQVGVRDPRELGLDLVHVGTGQTQTGIGTPLGFRIEAHRGTIGATCLVLGVPRATGVPCQIGLRISCNQSAVTLVRPLC